LRLRRTIAIVTGHSKRGWRAGTAAQVSEAIMVQTTNRFFDEVGRLMNDAAGVAQGVRREFETLFRSQAERFLRDLDVVKRDDFEAVKDMARLAREENEALKLRVAALEAALANLTPAVPSASGTASETYSAQASGGKISGG
jgi:BMFP domain-containing protein YqiC